MSPARGERIEREASAEVRYGYDRPAVGLQDLAPPVPEVPADQAAGDDERDAPDQEGASSPNHVPALLHRPCQTRNSRVLIETEEISVI